MNERGPKTDRYADMLRRLRCVEGHVRGVARMVEDGDECPAVLRQIMALHGALEKVSQILMAEHLNNCIPNELQGDERRGLERALDEVSDLLLEARQA